MNAEQKIAHWLEKGLSVKLMVAAVALIVGTWTASQTIEGKLANLREARAAEEIRKLKKENEELRGKIASENSGDAELLSLRDKVQALEVEKKSLAEALAQSTRDQSDKVEVLQQRLETTTAESSLAFEKQKGVLLDYESRLADLTRTNLKLEEDLKKAAERPDILQSQLYFNEAFVSVGQALTDKLTGATIGISDVSKGFNSVYGVVTFPDGTKEDVFSKKIGSGWGFVWERRRFIIVAASLEKDGRVRVVVKETTER